MSRWYDPISETWFIMPAPAAPVKTIEPPEDIYARADRLVRQANIWEAVKASATSSQMGTPATEE